MLRRREDERRDMRGRRRATRSPARHRSPPPRRWSFRLRRSHPGSRPDPRSRGQSESGQVEAVVAGALELRERRPPRFGQAVFADPNRRVGATGVKGCDRAARGAPVAAAERIAAIVTRDEPLTSPPGARFASARAKARRWDRRRPAAGYPARLAPAPSAFRSSDRRHRERKRSDPEMKGRSGGPGSPRRHSPSKTGVFRRPWLSR